MKAEGSQTKVLSNRNVCCCPLLVYMQVSLRILSGACKCEIGKRHFRTAASHRTGDIKGEAEGQGGPGKGRTKRRKVSPGVEGQKTLDSGTH